MKIEDVMTQGVRTCRLEDTCDVAARAMWESDCGAVPVVDVRHHVIGMITDRDLCMAAYTRGLAVAQMTVASVASHDVVSVGMSEPISAAEAHMRVARVRRLPVVDVDGVLVGIVSVNDLARHARGGWGRDATSAEELARTLAMISEHRGHTPLAAE